MENATNYYTIKIHGYIPISEYKGSFISPYSEATTFDEDYKYFTKTFDGKTEEVFEVCVIGGRSIKCYEYVLDLSERTTALSVELNDFFATKKSSSATITVKNFNFRGVLSDTGSTFLDSEYSSRSQDIPPYKTATLYNKFIRVGATIIITRNLAFQQDSSGYNIESLDEEFFPLFVGSIEEVGGSQDSIEIKAFDMINSLERIKCPYLAYNAISKQVNYNVLENAKKGGKEKLKITLSDVVEYINTIMSSKSTDKLAILLDDFDLDEMLALRNHTTNLAIKNLVDTGIDLLKGKINPFKDNKFSFEVEPTFFQDKKLSEILYTALDKFFTLWFIKNNVTSLSTNSSDAANHFIPCIYFSDVGTSTVAGYVLHLTTRFQYLAKKLNSPDYETLLELSEEEVILNYNIQSSGSSIVNQFNFIKETVKTDTEGKDIKTYEDSDSFPPVNTVESSDFTELLNSQAKYGIRDKNFLFTTDDLVKPKTFAKDLVFMAYEATKANFSLATSLIDNTTISNELTHLQTNFLLHIFKEPFNAYWLAIVTIKITISNAKLQLELGVIPSMEYVYNTPEICYLPPRNLEYTAV